MRLSGNKLVLLVRNGFKMCITATSFAFLMGERLMRWRLAMLDLNRINDVDQCVLFISLLSIRNSRGIVSLRYMLPIQGGDVLDPGQNQLEATCIL